MVVAHETWYEDYANRRLPDKWPASYAKAFSNAKTIVEDPGKAPSSGATLDGITINSNIGEGAGVGAGSQRGTSAEGIAADATGNRKNLRVSYLQ